MIKYSLLSGFEFPTPEFFEAFGNDIDQVKLGNFCEHFLFVHLSSYPDNHWIKFRAPIHHCNIKYIERFLTDAQMEHFTFSNLQQ
jgi:hypothetical protein